METHILTWREPAGHTISYDISPPRDGQRLRHTHVWCWCMIAIGLWIWLVGGRASAAEPVSPSFEFALIGDAPYNDQQEAKFASLMSAIDRAQVAFVVHSGDFKSGSSPCTDALFAQRYELFQRFKQPLVYIFGDNDWTDCHRSGADPLERLAKLRDVFARGDGSLGQRPLPLVRQSANPHYGKFREHVRWQVGGVLFVGLNIPGSNNNYPTKRRRGATVGDLAEYTERNAAALAWMRESFALAAEGGSPGLMLFIHGNPFPFTPNAPTIDGYEEFVLVLEAETRKFGKPVVLANGDSHYFRIDKPLPRPDLDGLRGPRLTNFTRVENFGSPDVHWVRGLVNPNDPALFRFQPEMVE